MWRRRHSAIIATLSVLTIILSADCGGKNGANIGGKSVMDNMQSEKETYSTYFANFRRSSFVPVPNKIKGEIAVLQGLMFPEGAMPRYIVLWDGRPVIESEANIAMYDAEGKRLWSRPKFQDSPFGLANNLLYYENNNFFMDAVDSSNRLILEDGSMPEVLDESYSVLMLAPQKNNYLAVVQFAGGPDGSSPTARPYMAKYGNALTEWGESIKGAQTLVPLYIPELKKVVVFMNEVIFIDATNGVEAGRVKFPLESPAVCSADDKGNLYFLGSDGGNSILVAMAPDGKEIWRFASPLLGEVSPERQPPILGANGMVYSLFGSTALAIKDGKLAWKTDFQDGGLKYGAALADSTLLVTAGRLLCLLDNAGKQVFAYDMEEILLTPPVVDKIGRIFVASGKTLFRLD